MSSHSDRSSTHGMKSAMHEALLMVVQEDIWSEEDVRVNSHLYDESPEVLQECELVRVFTFSL